MFLNFVEISFWNFSFHVPSFLESFFDLMTKIQRQKQTKGLILHAFDAHGRYFKHQ